GMLVYANNEIDTEYMLYIIDDLMADEELYTDEIKPIPEKIILFSAFPNPFNPITMVRFEIANENVLSLSLNVYTITGLLVETLVRGTIKPGEYAFPWYASQYASGVYIISLESNLGIQSQKIILLK
ncbi:MAG: T9SS type A sorting domain-containing protein, partial [Candidatus Neomarinimicrobiota bacterium]|nr:T9SS type A sorting domain-containing protein [Candidatus Neomarinimicrobiota bacterium]